MRWVAIEARSEQGPITLTYRGWGLESPRQLGFVTFDKDDDAGEWRYDFHYIVSANAEGIVEVHTPENVDPVPGASMKVGDPRFPDDGSWFFNRHHESGGHSLTLVYNVAGDGLGWDWELRGDEAMQVSLGIFHHGNLFGASTGYRSYTTTTPDGEQQTCPCRFLEPAGEGRYGPGLYTFQRTEAGAVHPYNCVFLGGVDVAFPAPLDGEAPPDLPELTPGGAVGPPAGHTTAPQAARDAEGATVAFIGTGLNARHTEFGGYQGQEGVEDPQIVAWWDFSLSGLSAEGEDWDPTHAVPWDGCPTGIGCTGTAVGALVGGQRIGAYPGVNLAAAKVIEGRAGVSGSRTPPPRAGGRRGRPGRHRGRLPRRDRRGRGVPRLRLGHPLRAARERGAGLARLRAGGGCGGHGGQDSGHRSTAAGRITVEPEP